MWDNIACNEENIQDQQIKLHPAPSVRKKKKQKQKKPADDYYFSGWFYHFFNPGSGNKFYFPLRLVLNPKDLIVNSTL